MTESRTCKYCGEEKELEHFHKVPSKSNPNYRDPACKPCRHASQYEATKRDPFRYVVARFRKKAKQKGLPFDLDAQYLEDIWTGTCPVFKTKLVLPYEAEANLGPNKTTPSLDRIIPEKGYVRGNVEWICTLSNTIKQTATAAELQAVADHVHLREKEIKKHEAD